MFCGQWFLNKHIDMVHKGMDLSVICDMCGKVLKTRMGLLAHLKTHAAEKRHGCHLCPKRFQDKGTLRKHLIREHGKAKGEEFTPGEGVVFKFVCMFPSCDAKFVTDIELQSHVGENHSPVGNNECMCTLCGRPFANQARLTRHHLKHSGEKPHACTVCSRSFQYRTSLKEHLQAVHSIGKEQECFPCDQPNCEGKYKIRKHLLRHLREFHGLTLGKATNLNIK
ncbi:putative zinc finger protein [Orchesella cincta]|uniref:Putative zinc finger protein n=1 Tax=Orchesella cincta TaxID=48709 RepID=A0A1D2M258_ORCCI|nr:putative zinc finger protein [Orchesella cincta]